MGIWRQLIIIFLRLVHSSVSSTLLILSVSEALSEPKARPESQLTQLESQLAQPESQLTQPGSQLACSETQLAQPES